MRASRTRCLPLVLLACLAGCGETPPNAGNPAAPATTATHSEPAPSTAADLFRERCAGCHTDPDNKRATQLPDMASLNAEDVVFAMIDGSMQVQAEGLSKDQIVELASWITGRREP